MSWDQIKTKLVSRKFWAAVAGLVTNVMIVIGKSENEAATVAAIIMAGAVVIAYIVGEGLIDAAAAGTSETNDPVPKES